MQPQRQTMTDRLADVIHIIQFGSKSGVLTVERGNGSTKEEGYITFVMGRVVEARVGQYNGPTAFNYLATWQTCLFALVAEAPRTQLPAPKTNPSTKTSITRTPFDVQQSTTYEKPQKSEGQSTLPYRLQRGEESIRYPERLPLSRLHRRLLILVDGQRRLDDLVRLMVRSPNEVQELLNDLVRGGFIRCL
jgi:hypothetical protein